MGDWKRDPTDGESYWDALAVCPCSAQIARDTAIAARVDADEIRRRSDLRSQGAGPDPLVRCTSPYEPSEHGGPSWAAGTVDRLREQSRRADAPGMKGKTMNSTLLSALRSGSLSSLGCVYEPLLDGERFFSFGGSLFRRWAYLSPPDRCELVSSIIDWHDDLTDADSDDVREVLRQVMV